jgi:hypothetical protein
VLDLKQVAQALLPIISDRIEAQAAEIERLRIEAQAQFDRGYYDGCTRQPTQSDAVIELLETMRERCTHPCRSEKAELGCDCDAARQAAVILRQPTQSDALRDQLLQECLVKLRDVQGTEAPKQYACNLIKRIERVLQGQSK